MSDKTLVERLIEAKPIGCENFARIFDIECKEQPDCITCRRVICCSIANAIEGEYIPRPRYEDGEPVQFGDIYTDKHGREWKNGIKSINIDCNGNFSLHDNTIGSVGRYEVFEQNRRVKRYKPDSIERIEKDAEKRFDVYWKCSGIDCSNCPAIIDGKKPDERYETIGDCLNAQKLDLLYRQRKVLERDSNG